MTIKELKKILKEYDENTEIKLGKIVEDIEGGYYYDEIELKENDIMTSRYDGKTTIILG